MAYGMETLGGLWDSVTGLFGGGDSSNIGPVVNGDSYASSLGQSSGSSTPWYASSEFLKPAITTGVGLIGGLTTPEAKVPYSQSQQYLDAKAAQDAAQFQQELALKYAALAQGAGGGGGSAAASAAMYQAKLNAKLAMAQARNAAKAEAIKARIEAKYGHPEIRQGYANTIVELLAGGGQQAQSGFNSAANLLAQYRK